MTKIRKKTIGQKISDIDKPAASYATLIGKAIMDTEEKRARLSTIYNWIAENYPCKSIIIINKDYKIDQGGWQNSIRHNLTVNKCFIKDTQKGDTSGKGSYWTIHPDHLEFFLSGVFEKPKGEWGENMGSIMRQRKKSLPTPKHSKHVLSLGNKCSDSINTGTEGYYSSSEESIDCRGGPVQNCVNKKGKGVFFTVFSKENGFNGKRPSVSLGDNAIINQPPILNLKALEEYGSVQYNRSESYLENTMVVLSERNSPMMSVEPFITTTMDPLFCREDYFINGDFNAAELVMLDNNTTLSNNFKEIFEDIKEFKNHVNFTTKTSELPVVYMECDLGRKLVLDDVN